jgi:uncharacterized repeat protein (TIGR02543 family)
MSPIISFAADNPPLVEDVHTVTFVHENGSVYKEIEVAHGETAPSVTAPSVQGKVFTGYTYTEGSNASATFICGKTVVTRNLEVTANYEASLIKVTFYDGIASDARIIKTKSVAYGASVTANDVEIPDSAVPSGSVFTGEWVQRDAPQSRITFPLTVTANTYIAPEIVSGHEVTFISNGVAVSHKITRGDTPVSKPTDPQRGGRTFVAWYMDEGCTHGYEWNFGDNVTANMTLYAKWTDNPVRYSINYWLEKPGIPLNSNDQNGGLSNSASAEYSAYDTANYKLAYRDTNQSLTAATGATVTVPATDLSVANMSSEPNKAIRKMLGGSDTNTTLDENLYSYHHSDTQVVNGNGTTTVNVYFTRTVWKVDFQLNFPSEKSVSNAILRWKVDSQTLTTIAGTPASAPLHYTIYAKTGTDVSALYPSLQDADGLKIECVGLDGITSLANFRGWGPHYIASLDSLARSDIDTYPNSKDYAHKTIQFTTDNGSWFPASSGTLTRYYVFVESLDQTSEASAPDQTAQTENSSRLEINTLMIRSGGSTNSSSLTSLTIPEGERYFDRHAVSSYYYANTGDRQVMTSTQYPGFSGEYLNGYFSTGNTDKGGCYQWQQTSGDGLFYQLTSASNSNRADTVRYFFLSRNSYDLSFDTGGGTVIPEYTGDTAIKFEKSLTNYEPQDPTRNGDIFAGWYKDAECTVPFDFETEKMPAGNLTLYAKWIRDPVYIEYYTGLGDESPILDVDEVISNGDAADEPGSSIFKPDFDIHQYAPYVGATFLGWFISTEDGWIEYKFDTPITANTKLHARWASSETYFHITYDTAGATASGPIDGRIYLAGTEATVLNGNHLVNGNKVFVGWRRADTGEMFWAGSRLHMTDNIRLIATYADASNTVTITFHEGQGGASDVVTWRTVKNATVEYPEADYLDFENNGYDFIGWALQTGASHAENTYAVGGKSKLAKATYLYAVWKETPTVVGVDAPPRVTTVATATNTTTTALVIKKAITDAVTSTSVNFFAGKIPAEISDSATSTDINSPKGNSASGSDGGTQDIASGGIPLASGSSSDYWSLANFLMSFASSMITIGLLIGIFVRRKLRRTKVSVPQFIAIAAGIVTSLVWCLLDDISKPMALVTDNTLWVGAVFMLQLVCLGLYLAHREKSVNTL